MPATERELTLLTVGAGLLEGWAAKTTCPGCGAPGVYYLAYDASCCLRCNRWLEVYCPEPDCIHCRLRPGRPVSGSGRREHGGDHE